MKVVELSPETAALAARSTPLGPNPLWKHPGFKLPHYIRNLARGLAKAFGTPADSDRAIATAIYNCSKWKDGIPTGNMPRVRPETRAAAAAAWAEFEAERARTHAAKSEHALLPIVQLAQKHTHAECHYRDGSVGRNCSSCLHYFGSGSGGTSHCRIVQDPINPQGLCDYFKATTKLSLAMELAAKKPAAPKAVTAAKIAQPKVATAPKAPRQPKAPVARAVKAAPAKAAAKPPTKSPPGAVAQKVSQLRATAASDIKQANLLDAKANAIEKAHAPGKGSTSTAPGTGSTSSSPAPTAPSSHLTSTQKSKISKGVKASQSWQNEVNSLRNQAKALRAKAKQLYAEAAALMKSEGGHGGGGPTGQSAGMKNLKTAAANAADVYRDVLEMADVTPKVSVGENQGMIALEPVHGRHKGRHVTLAYLGPNVTDEQHRHALRAAMQLATEYGPVKAKAGGIMRFPAGPDGSPDVVPVDAPVLDEMHLRLRARGLHRSEHGFHAHMTVKYSKPGEAMPAPLPEEDVHFPHIAVHRGKQVHRFPLVGHMHAQAREYALEFARRKDDTDPRYHSGEQPTSTRAIGGRKMAQGTPTATMRRSALKKGAALPPAEPGGDPRFPITNAELLKRAIRMVGLAKGNKAAIRRYIMRRAAALHLEHLIPEHWRSNMAEAAMDALDFQASVELALELAHKKQRKPTVVNGKDGKDVKYPGGATVHHHRAAGSRPKGGRKSDPDNDNDDDTNDKFDINDETSLRSAIKKAHRTKHPAAVRRHIRRRARALGKEHMIPPHWQTDGTVPYGR